MWKSKHLIFFWNWTFTPKQMNWSTMHLLELFKAAQLYPRARNQVAI